VILEQSRRLLQSLGDVHPSDVKVACLERIAALYPGGAARVILGQSGADAVSAALKTAALATGRPGVVAFQGAYHGLSYGPLAACGLRAGYREPFRDQLNPHVRFVPYPSLDGEAETSLDAAQRELQSGRIGAVIIEPILGRGGCVVPPPGFLASLTSLAHEHGALLVADEIWTGLGRAGHWLAAPAAGCVPDLVCLAKGLGGGVPLSACVGSDAILQAWHRTPEVVHTATFAGAPLACAASLVTLAVLEEEALVERAARVGADWSQRLRSALQDRHGLEIRGAGLMIGIGIAPGGPAAPRLAQSMLERGYLVSTGGGGREVLVLTPPLTVSDGQLEAFDAAVAGALEAGA
jgi:4-aminobutyrate aminotransferase/(S)-3-amino-2-methylpropionate transaminase